MDEGTILSVLIGIGVGWFISYTFYVRSNKEQKELFEKLPVQVREEILKSSTHHIERDELLEILNKMANAPIATSRLEGNIDGGTY